MKLCKLTLTFLVFLSASLVQADPPDRTFEIQQPRGVWQVPKDIQQPTGPWKLPGDIQVPKGIEVRKGDDAAGCESRLVISSDTLFDFDKATLTVASESTLAELIPVLNHLAPSRVIIEGHTDSKGPADYNEDLSRRRADAVARFFEKNWSESVIAINGYGEGRPVAPNEKPDGSDDPDGRQKNRRVEVVVKTCKAS